MVLVPFNELPQAKKGRECENAVLRFLWHRLGYITTPLSKIEDVPNRGPRFYVPPNDHNSDLPRQLILPDLLCIQLTGWCSLTFELPEEFFVDVKSKGRASWYRTNEAWQSGIDRRVYNQYREADKLTKKPVWIFHLIEQATQEQMDQQRVPPHERPNPTGLYAHSVLQSVAPDPFDHHGTSRLVYWQIKDMLKIAELDEVMS